MCSSDLADHGFSAYANTIEASDKLITEDPDLINRFISASRQGWEDFLTNDPQPAFDLIKNSIRTCLPISLLTLMVR